MQKAVRVSVANNTQLQNSHIKELEALVEKQSQRILELERKLNRMTELLANAQRARFGQSSEKKEYVLGKNLDQVSIFNEAEVEQDGKVPEPT